ncbi:Alpha/Beta hydrolase protein [Spinellus fusiger]|nr:Alpha/Beta hydrolase protein [Spinellus fusiger]
MVVASFSILYHYFESTLAANSTTISVSLPLLVNRFSQKLSSSSSESTAASRPLLSTKRKADILYPRRLKRENEGAFHFDTSAAAQFFSPCAKLAADKVTVAEMTVDPVHTATAKSEDSVHATATATATANTATTTTATTTATTTCPPYPTGLDLPISPHYRAPRAPIVLCHGLYGFDVWGPNAFPALQLHYWHGIEDALAKLGAKVIVTSVPKTGSIQQRAHELDSTLKGIMSDKEVNFIAHSMGGLDCRYLLSHIKDRAYHARSLTTVCTPHRGSSLMDWFRDNVGVGAVEQIQPTTDTTQPPSMSLSTRTVLTRKVVRVDPTPSIATAWCQSNDTKGASLRLPKTVVHYFDEPAYSNLTTDYCRDYFNPTTPDDPTVAYYSYGAAAHMPAWSSLLGVPWQMVKEKEGDNDGIVSVQSAQWGQYVKTLQADHWDLSGKSYFPYRINPEPKSTFDRENFYVELANHLYNEGH